MSREHEYFRGSTILFIDHKATSASDRAIDERESCGTEKLFKEYLSVNNFYKI